MKICCLTIIEDKKNHKLLMVENLRGINKGFVNFPGGKREFNETIENSSIRESLEETGIIPINIKTAGKIVYKPADIEMYIYYCDKCKREFQIEISADIRKDSIETNIKRCGYYKESEEEYNE